MLRTVTPLFIFLLMAAGVFYWPFSPDYTYEQKQPSPADASDTAKINEPEFEVAESYNNQSSITADRYGFFRGYRTPDLSTWKRPEGPPKVALQVGHWKTDELPDELSRLRERGGGTSGGGKKEWEVNLKISQETKRILEAKGVAVEIIPATVPISYWVDIFLSVHADGNANPNASGFKSAAPWRDFTGMSDDLISVLDEEYQKTTGMEHNSNITRNMRGYYAFNWWRYEHSVHPMTISAIIETGFLTSPNDQKILIGDPKRAASGIANGIIRFLKK